MLFDNRGLLFVLGLLIRDVGIYNRVLSAEEVRRSINRHQTVRERGAAGGKSVYTDSANAMQYCEGMTWRLTQRRLSLSVLREMSRKDGAA